MALGPARFSSYTPICLSEEHYRLLRVGDNKLCLHFNVNSIYQYKDSVGELLAAVEEYEKSSFLQRWRRRLGAPIGSLPIRVQQQKLLLVCEQVWREQNKQGQAQVVPGDQPKIEPGSLLDRVLKRAKPFSHRWEKRLMQEKQDTRSRPIRWLGLGKTHKALSGEVQSLWQGILFFMRILLSRKKTSTEEDLEREAAKSKRSLHTLYVDVENQLAKSYFSGEAKSPHEWQGIVKQAEKDLNSRKEELRASYRNPKDWVASNGTSQEALQKQLTLQNATFDQVEFFGQESVDRVKAKIQAFETLRLNLVKLEEEAKSQAEALVESSVYDEANLTRLSRERAQLKAKYFGCVLFSPESYHLQSKHGVLINDLKAFFARNLNRVNEPFVEAQKKIRMKRRTKEGHVLHQDFYKRYRGFLERGLRAFLRRDSESVEKEHRALLEEWERFSKDLEGLQAALHKNYLVECLPEWRERIENLGKALSVWAEILKKHKQYEKHLKEMESLANFLGFAPTPDRYHQLSEAHANGLREILGSSYKTHHYVGELSDQLEQIIFDFTQTLESSEKIHRQRYPVSTEISRPRAQKNPILACGHIYENYNLQLMHATYNNLLLNEQELSTFIETATLKMKRMWEQLAQELKDFPKSPKQLSEYQEFERKGASWEKFMTLFFKTARSQQDNLKKLSTGSDPALKEKISKSQSLREGLEGLHEMSQEVVFGRVKEELLDQNGRLEDLSLENDLKQVQVSWLNRRVLSFKHDDKTSTYFLFMKTQLLNPARAFPKEPLESVIKDCEALRLQWRVAAVKNMCAGLKDPDVLSRPDKAGEERALRENEGRAYIVNSIQRFRQQMEVRRQNERARLQDKNPDLGLFIRRYLDFSWASFEKKVLKYQKSTLLFYQSNPSSLPALKEDSELFDWFSEARESLWRLIQEKVVECLEMGVGDPFHEVKKYRDAQQEWLCERLYQRLASEKPEQQLRALSYAQKIWDKNWRFNSDCWINHGMVMWEWSKECTLQNESEDSLRENEECGILLKTLFEKKSRFWSQDWSEGKSKNWAQHWPSDKLNFERLLSFQKSGLRRVAGLQSKVARRAKIEKSQKMLKKMLHIFLLIYHEDKYRSKPEIDEKTKAFLSGEVHCLKKQVEDLIKLSENPDDLLYQAEEFSSSNGAEEAEEDIPTSWEAYQARQAQFKAEHAKAEAEHAKASGSRLSSLRELVLPHGNLKQGNPFAEWANLLSRF